MCKGWGALALTSVLTGLHAGSGPPSVDPAGILRKADAPQEAFSEGVLRLRVVVNERGKEPVANVLQLFVKGTDQSLVVFREGKQEGRKILTLGERVFLIVPGASRPIPVGKSQRLMGAASVTTIARLRLSDDYEATLRAGEENIAGPSGATACRVLDLAAKRPGSAYPSAVLWVGRDDGLARRLLLSVASGKEAKDVLFTSYDEEHRVAAMEIRDLLADRHANVTNLTFEGYEKRALDPAIFELPRARAVP